jgi:hypothetical protein
MRNYGKIKNKRTMPKTSICQNNSRVVVVVVEVIIVAVDFSFPLNI